jgi:hypothetical protein
MTVKKTPKLRTAINSMNFREFFMWLTTQLSDRCRTAVRGAQRWNWDNNIVEALGTQTPAGASVANKLIT